MSKSPCHSIKLTVSAFCFTSYSVPDRALVKFFIMSPVEIVKSLMRPCFPAVYISVDKPSPTALAKCSLMFLVTRSRLLFCFVFGVIVFVFSDNLVNLSVD
jgi:hypothetical protein